MPSIPLDLARISDNKNDRLPAAQLVSCLVLCRNEAKFIARCLDAVLAFELPLNTIMECLVVDGRLIGSSRGIVEACDSWDKMIRRIRRILSHKPIANAHLAN